ncbi:hypothetical protein OV208_24770 [Corallococcus sp. bb12-1]|uniref:hypothetical protein n=1 Tax=Corallococcus sp. bb12-1 TaxID=2996784 RepID=UPI00226F8E7B|nr:hypothetical protein [Corallococcus sp. bb12-1]MCY1044554.1 hypothetical protein [Corallococcus sp. bb12-1]
MAVRLASIVCLLAALPAAANVAASTRTPATFTLSSGTARTRSEVLSEKLDFDCAEAEQEAVCHFEARYRLRNGTPEAEVVDAAFLGLRTREVSVQFDEEPLPVTEAQAASMGPTSDSGRLAHSPAERFGFTLTLPPGREGELRVRGLMQLERRFLPSGYVWPAIQSRHALLSPGPEQASHWDIDYLLGPIRTWAGNPTLHITVRVPSAWEVGSSPDASARTLPVATGWRLRHEGEHVVAERRLTAASAPEWLNVTLTKRKPWWTSGGVQLGLGARLGDESRFMARLGYQFATPESFLHSLSVETDFREQVVLTPLTQYATPQVAIIPSFGLGLGIPVQVLPEARPGLRLLADLHFGPLGAALSWDHYPALREGTDSFSRLILLFQVAL